MGPTLLAHRPSSASSVTDLRRPQELPCCLMDMGGLTFVSYLFILKMIYLIIKQGYTIHYLIAYFIEILREVVQ